MDTTNIFTPELAEIRFYTTLQFPLPEYMKRDWKVRIDMKYHFNGDEDFEDLCMYSTYQHGGLTESIKHYPSPINCREITYHFECLDIEYKLGEDCVIGKHLIEVFKKCIEKEKFKEYKESYYMEYIYHSKKEHKLPTEEEIREEYWNDPKIKLNHSLADS